MLASPGFTGYCSEQGERLASADVVIVVAGMDGALPSVVGGLVVDCPVIACPTSIGYGAAFGGVASAMTMLNSCSAGVCGGNIDAGFKAGCVAQSEFVKKATRPTPRNNSGRCGCYCCWITLRLRTERSVDASRRRGSGG